MVKPFGRHRDLFLQPAIADAAHHAVAHGEGRAEFADANDLDMLTANGQVGMRYVDNHGAPAAHYPANPNGSPEGVTGLAVPGMPLGSPGMEMGDRVQPYEVIAFGPDGQKVFASYP